MRVVLRLSLQSEDETNDPLKSGPALAGPAGPPTPPLQSCLSTVAIVMRLYRPLMLCIATLLSLARSGLEKKVVDNESKEEGRGEQGGG